jgi:endonuclease III related protein
MENSVTVVGERGRMNSHIPLTPAVRLRRIHDKLAKAYGPQHWWPAETPFEVVLGAYLTQNTSWKAVERSLENLHKAGSLTIEGIRALTLDQFKKLIRPSGFYTRKAQALKAFVRMLDEEFGGSLDALARAPTEDVRRRLLALPSVGMETADAILLYALGHAVPVADEYLRRIAERHNLVTPVLGHNRRYEALVQLTREAFSDEQPGRHVGFFGEFHALSVAVGKAHCAKTAHCTGCPLKGDLTFVKKQISNNQ